MGPLLPRSTDIPGLKGLRPPSHLVEFLMHGWVGGHFNFFFFRIDGNRHSLYIFDVLHKQCVCSSLSSIGNSVCHLSCDSALPVQLLIHQ